ncbi:TNF receptor-associated factor 4-like [Dysidea avara]|uniref:TNF receptor-associated factor 4-like n=1 Tax=Dysidea avara TaxID=196820 RepID=UPI0033195D61
MCANKEIGCEWQGKLNDINNCIGIGTTCQFEDVKRSSECGNMLQQQHLIRHVKNECSRRIVDCQYCYIPGEHWLIEGEHKKHCPKYHLPCPNQCEIESILHEDMKAHKQNCPLEKVACSNECGMILQRCYLTLHIKERCSRRKVKCIYCHITDEYWFIEEDHKDHCPKLPLPCPNKCKVGSVHREDMEAHVNECPLEMIQCEYHSIGCKAKMTRASKRKHEEENTEEHLLMTKRKLAKTESELTSTETRLTSLEVMVHRLINSTGSSNRLIDSSQWSNHLTTMAKRVAVTQICPVTVKMSKFSENKEREVAWYSDPFFSQSKGYKMCLRVDAAGVGDEKGTHLSVFLYLMKGPYDDELRWPLRGKFEFELLNQISDCYHYSMTITCELRAGPGTSVTSRVTSSNRAFNGWGLPDFISHAYLNKVTHTCQYLKDDCIFLQVSKL